MSVTPSQFSLISQLMDATAVRLQVTGQNIANVNTPGYQSLEVNFEQQLASELADHQDAERIDVSPRVERSEGLTRRADGNNVDIDRELGQLQKNSLLQGTYARVLAARISQMRSAINGR